MAVVLTAGAQNLSAQLVDGQPKNETQVSARRENFPANTNLPSLFLIGDSTVRNGSGRGDGGQWGWGDKIAVFFDTSKINVVNRALGGTTSRTFYRDLWPRVLAMLKPGDFVIMQFGTNGGAVNDASRARGEIHGIGDETQEITNLVTKKFEVVHTFGWYEKQMIAEARSKGATAMVCSLIPRNNWKNGQASRNGPDSAAGWAAGAANAVNAPFIDNNEIIARLYDELGQEKVNALFVTGCRPAHEFGRGSDQCGLRRLRSQGAEGKSAGKIPLGQGRWHRPRRFKPARSCTSQRQKHRTEMIVMKIHLIAHCSGLCLFDPSDLSALPRMSAR